MDARVLAAAAGLCFAGASNAGLFPASATWSLSGTGSWETGANWTGGSAPDNDGVLLWTANVTQFDGVFYDVNINSDILLSALRVDSRFVDVEVLGPASLEVLGATVLTAGEIRVTGDATFGGLLTTGNSSGRAGFLTMAGGTATLAGGMDINDGGIFGQGMLHATGGLINNDDQIRGALGGTLTIDLDGGTLDMDGASGAGQVQALLGSVQINGGITDSFNGSVQIGNGWSFGVSNNWTLSTNGVLEFIAGTGTVNGAGEINVIGTGQIRTNGGDGVIDADVSINGGSLVADTDELLTLNGSVEMNTGSMTVNGTMTNASTMVLFGGSASIASTGEFVNTGTIQLFNGGSLTGPGLLRNNNGVIDFRGDSFVSVGALDLDGAAGGEGTVIVREGVTGTFASINVEQAGSSFDGTLDLRGGTLDMQLAGSWLMNSGSDLLSSVDASTLTTNQAITLGGRIDADEELTISAPSYTLGSTLQVDVASGATVQFTGSGARTILGGTYTGNGTFSIGGPQNINGDVTFDVNVLDWDGQEGGGWTTLIGDGVDVVINSSQLESGNPATDGYDGIVRIGVGSTLEVNTASDWRMDGALILRDGAILQTGVTRGSAPMARIFGDLLVFAGEEGSVTAPIALEAGSDTIVDGGESLLLADAYFRGGAVFGGGTLFNAGQFTVESNQTIGVTTLDLDGAGFATTVIEDGVSLSITSDFIDAGNNIFNGTIMNAGSLNITTMDGEWTNVGSVQLIDGALTGDDVANIGVLSGYGAIGVSVDNDGGSINASGGLLTLNNTLGHDYDGTNETGIMRAVDGSLQITSGFGSFGYDSLIEIGGGNTFDSGALDLLFNNASELLYVSDGVYVADSTSMFGTTTIQAGADARHEGDLSLGNGSMMNAAGDWSHDTGALTVASGATVNVQNTGSVTAAGDSFVNAAGSNVTVAGLMNLEADSQTFQAGSEISVTPSGTLNLRRDLTLTNSGIFQVDGVANVDSSTMTLTAGPSSFQGSGELRLMNGGQLQGSGVIGLDTNNLSGRIDPAFASVGQIGIQGDYTQTEFALYDADLTASTSDTVVVTGDATLAGSLNVYYSGFTPDWGDEWEIMSFSGGSGDFDDIDFIGASLGMNLYWYTERTATAYLVGVRDVADVNHDGVVDFSDLNAVLAQFGNAGAGLIGDANQDGLVDFGDLNAVLARFGLTAPVSRAIPAPGAAALFGLAALAAGRRRRR